MAQPIEEEGVHYVDVTDPASGSTFRFYDVEYSIACAMDGARDVDNLAEWTRAELGIETSPEELVSVINTLADLGYLEGVAAASSDEYAEGDGYADEGQAYETAEGSEGIPETMEPQATEAEVAPSAYTDEADVELEIGEPPPMAAAEEEPDHPRDPDVEVPREAQAAEESDEPEIELGPPGNPVVDEVAAKQEPEQAPEQEAATPAPVDEAEVSFAGILDEEEAGKTTPTPAPPSPPPRPIARMRREPAQQLDDEDPTQVPTAAIEEDDEDVSVDLGVHMALDKAEVAEAVRSSRVHSVPEVPRELTLEIGDDDNVAEEQPVAAKAPPPPPPAPAAPPPPPAPAPVMAEARREERLSTKPSIEEPRVPPAIALPSRPPAPISNAPAAKPRISKPIEPTKVPPPAKAPPQKRASIGLFIVLLLIVAAALVYFFRDQIFGSGEPSQTSQPQGTPSLPKAPPPSTKPDEPPPTPKNPPETANLPAAALRTEEAKATSVDVKAPAAGTVAWIAPADSAVEAGAPILRLNGYAKHEAVLKEATARGEFYAKKLEDAKAKGDTAGADSAQKKVDEKKALVDSSQAELDKLTAKAPVAGTVKLLVALGAAVKAEDTVATFDGAAQQTTVATFDVGAGADKYTVDGACTVSSKAAPDKQFACVVTKNEGGKVDVRLVTTEGTTPPAAGEEVVLQPAAN